MRRFALAAALLVPAAIAPAVPAGAQGPATIRGVVYDCANGEPLAASHVTLRNVATGTTFDLVSSRAGRFVRVGVEPGRYLISATDPSAATRGTAFAASRLASVESDDVVDLRIGARPSSARGFAIRPGTPVAAPEEPHPLCDAALVPRAVSPTTRYIVH